MLQRKSCQSWPKDAQNFFTSVVLKLEQTLELPVGPVKTAYWAPPPEDFLIQQFRDWAPWGTFTPHKFPGDSDDADQGPHFENHIFR